MAKVSNPILLLATTLLLLGINVSLQTDRARANETDSTGATPTDGTRADSCLAAPPKALAPTGKHWYFVTDRQKGRKCWYLHTTLPLGHHAAARSHSAARPRSSSAARPRSHAATSAESTAKPAAPEAAPPSPAPTNTQTAFEAASVATTVPTAVAGAMPAATGAGSAADASPPAGAADDPQPHIQILRTVPIGVPTQPATQSSAPVTQVLPAAQSGSTTAVSDATSTGSADAGPSNAGSDAKSDAKNAASAAHDSGPNGESSGSDDAQQNPEGAPGVADTDATFQPTEVFFLVAIGLSMVVFLIAIARRIAARGRDPIITDYPCSAWSNDQSDLLQVDDAQFADEAKDEQCIDADPVPFIDPQGIDDVREPDWTERPLAARSNLKKSASSTVRSEPDSEGFAPVLRLLRQA